MMGTKFCVESLKKSNAKLLPLSTPHYAFCEVKSNKTF